MLIIRSPPAGDCLSVFERNRRPYSWIFSHFSMIDSDKTLADNTVVGPFNYKQLYAFVTVMKSTLCFI